MLGSDGEPVIALVGFDKKAIGDVFYARAAVRGEAMVDAWLRQKGSSDERGKVHPRQTTASTNWPIGPTSPPRSPLAFALAHDTFIHWR
jgi:hypothetical protein